MHFLGLRMIFKRIVAIKFLLKDPLVPKRKKILVVFGLIYLFVPIDIVPIIVFPFGITDDLILWCFILWYLKDELDSYWNNEEEDLSGNFEKKNIVEGVNYSVDNDAVDKKKSEDNNGKK